jgi:hypothetical protein
MDSIRFSHRSHRDNLRNILTQNLSTKICALSFVLLLPLIQSDAQRPNPPGYINDNSDWWSFYVGNSQSMNVKVQHRMPAPSNFQILGITLGGSRFSDFDDMIAKLGGAKVTSRSDGADGRKQICYASSGSADKVHLIFETGDIMEAFYLFSGGTEWTGSDRCVNSDLISGNLGTASGIHLGQDRKDAETMLGQPSATYDKRTVYSFEGERTLTPEEFKKLHPDSAGFPNETLVYTIDVRIDARFENSKVTYLAISRSEVN